MNARSTRIATVGASIALAGLLWGGAAFAQGIPQPRVSQETCAEVNWAPKLLQQYPRLPEACQEVVVVNGENWARIEGRLIKENPNGSITAMVVDPQGRGMGRITLKPSAGQKVILEGKEVPFDQLESGAMLHMYIPEHMYAVATEPVEDTTEMATIEPAPETELAAAEPQELPTTAGPLPWIFVVGAGLLFVGIALTLARRFRH